MTDAELRERTITSIVEGMKYAFDHDHLPLKQLALNSGIMALEAIVQTGAISRIVAGDSCAKSSCDVVV